MFGIKQYEVIVDIKTTATHERIISFYGQSYKQDGVLLHVPMYELQCELSNGTWLEMDRHEDIDLLKNEMTFVRSLFPLD